MNPIRDFYKINDLLVTSGQPTAEQLEQLAGQKYEFIINLGLLNTDYALGDEHTLVKNLGMEYYHIPVEFGNPTEEDFHEFCEKMNLTEKRKTLVHCAANKRASVFAALWLLKQKSIDSDKCLELIENIWEPNLVWKEFIEEQLEKLSQ